MPRTCAWLAVVLVLAGCGEAAAPREAPAPSGPTVALTEWQLVEALAAGGDPLAPAGVEEVLRFDGGTGYSTSGCNSTTGTAEVHESTIRFTGDVVTTAAGCSGPAGELERAFGELAMGDVDWSITGNQLILRGAGTFTYEQRRSIWPQDDATELVSWDDETGQFRLGVHVDQESGVLLSLVADSRPGPGRPWGTQGIAIDGDPPLYTLIVTGTDVPFVAGAVPSTTVRATHRDRPGAEPVELTVYPTADPATSVIAGYVTTHTAASVLTAYDAAGEVTASVGG